MKILKKIMEEIVICVLAILFFTILGNLSVNDDVSENYKNDNVKNVHINLNTKDILKENNILQKSTISSDDEIIGDTKNLENNQNNDKFEYDKDVEDNKNKKNINNLKYEIDNSFNIININKADIKELTSIKGIGLKTAEKIIEYRDKNGFFKKKEDIMNVKGIGKNKYEKIKEFIDIK